MPMCFMGAKRVFPLFGSDGGRAGLEGRPVRRANDLLVRRKDRPERERERRGPVLLEMGESLLRLVDRGDVLSGNPPQDGDRTLELLEPLAALSEHFRLFPAEDEV